MGAETDCEKENKDQEVEGIGGNGQERAGKKSIQIDEDLHREISHLAIDLDTSIGPLTTSLLREALAAKKTGDGHTGL